MSFATADLVDEFGDGVRSCATQLRQYGARTRFAGEIVTIECCRDNALIKERLATDGHGKVLVVDGEACLDTALMGDMIAASAVANGWSGVIINGAVRDTVALAGLDLGVKALGSNPRKSGKTGSGKEQIELAFGGVNFVPGQYLWSDEDGILVADSNNPQPTNPQPANAQSTNAQPS